MKIIQVDLFVYLIYLYLNYQKYIKEQKLLEENEQVSTKTTTVVEQGAYVDMTNATVNAIGKLLIQAGASFKATVGQYANIEDYSKTLVK